MNRSESKPAMMKLSNNLSVDISKYKTSSIVRTKITEHPDEITLKIDR